MCVYKMPSRIEEELVARSIVHVAALAFLDNENVGEIDFVLKVLGGLGANGQRRLWWNRVVSGF